MRKVWAGDACQACSDWLQDPDTAEMLNLVPGPWPVEAQAKFFASFKGQDRQCLLGLFEGSRLVGLFLLTLNPEHGTFMITHLIGDRRDRGKGHSERAMVALLDYFFNKLDYVKAKCNVNPSNRAVLWSLLTKGWRKEGRLEKQMRSRHSSARHDLICLAMFRPDLNLAHGE